jgi:hypothetical protein
MSAQATRRTIVGAVVALLLLTLLLASCWSPSSGANSTPPPSGQITRPTNAGLPLGDQAAVAAFDAANQFLIDWLFLANPARAAERISLDLQPTWTQFLQDTLVEGECSLTQTSGAPLDAAATTVVGYRIDGCVITPPGQEEAAELYVTVTATDANYWVVGVAFS